MKYIIIVFISLLIFACNDNKSDEKITDNEENIEDSNDIFSNKEIVFGKLELGKNYTNENKYYIKNIDASFSPPINSIQLSEEEKNMIIEQTGFFKDDFYTDSLFINERMRISCLVGYMEKEGENLNSFIDSLRNMKEDKSVKKFTEEYFIINGKKNIQFQLNIDNAAFWFYAIFESKNGYYLILNYTFTITYFEDSLAVIANSLNSITF